MDMICRKTMTRCQTPGMCSPHGGCQDPVVAELRAVNFDYQLGADAASTEIARLKAEIDRLRTAEGDAMTYKAGMENVAQQRDQLKAENEALRRRAEFWRSPDDMPESGAEVVALRDAGIVGNGLHPGSRTGRWLELTTTFGRMFACDAISTGRVIGWVPVEEFLGFGPLCTDAARYRYMRDFPYNNISRAVGITDGRHFWLQFEEADKAIDKVMRDDNELLDVMSKEADSAK